MNDLDVTLRVFTAVLLGGLIGVERGLKGHPAGLRTYMLVSLGSALFMIASELIAERAQHLAGMADPTRIASTIVQGVGFLGAGIIFQSRLGIRNLTTAASVWVVAAIGMLSGAGLYLTAIIGTGFTAIVLAGLPPLEAWLNRQVAANAPSDENQGESRFDAFE